jgi:hypothetical protein
MDRKYDGNDWCKVITTNIKNKLNLALGRLIAWVIYVVCKTIVTTLCTLALTMKPSSAMNAFIF